MKFNGSALQIHNCFNLLELRCIDLVTNINLIFDFPTTDVHSYFLFSSLHSFSTVCETCATASVVMVDDGGGDDATQGEFVR